MHLSGDAHTFVKCSHGAHALGDRRVLHGDDRLIG